MACTEVLSPGTQQPHWKLDSFPASSGLKDFLGKLIFARDSMWEGVRLQGMNCSHVSAAGS